MYMYARTRTYCGHAYCVDKLYIGIHMHACTFKAYADSLIHWLAETRWLNLKSHFACACGTVGSGDAEVWTT